jgi:hypothetical protein
MSTKTKLSVAAQSLTESLSAVVARMKASVEIAEKHRKKGHLQQFISQTFITQEIKEEGDRITAELLRVMNALNSPIEDKDEN